MSRELPESEQKALDALLAAVLRTEDIEGDIPDEVVVKYMNGDFELTSEDEAALARLDDAVFDRLRRTERGPDPVDPPTEPAMLSDLCSTMNRQNEESKLDDKAKAELDKQREKFLRKLRGKEKSEPSEDVS